MEILYGIADFIRYCSEKKLSSNSIKKKGIWKYRMERKKRVMFCRNAISMYWE
jgi:hypothetical protein